jgi:uncharacterized protein YijF (DUF1287 family)
MKSEKLLLLIFLLNVSFSVCSGQAEITKKLSVAAIALTKQDVNYDPSYFKISYPNGDVPSNKGVCTDVIIRAYRKLGIDLQKEIHEDMQKNFAIYPKNWGLKTTDSNIDHRRVPNLMTYFSRHGKVLRKSTQPSDYHPGEIVTWDLGNGVLHIGIIIDKKTNDGLRYMVVHNIGNGQEISDCLFSYAIIGHYQYAY